MLYPHPHPPKNRCHFTPLPPHNGHLSTTATFFSCPQGGRYREVHLWVEYTHPSESSPEIGLLLTVTKVSTICVVAMQDAVGVKVSCITSFDGIQTLVFDLICQLSRDVIGLLSGKLWCY